MFNPNNITNFNNIWNRLSTFYNFLTKEDKSVVETYWKELFNGLEGLRYDLAQSTLTGVLDYTPGYIEDVYQEYDIDLDNNVEINSLTTPVIVSGYCMNPTVSGLTFNFKITALNEFGETTGSDSIVILSGHYQIPTHPIYLEWEEVDGATEYNIYGGLLNNFFYLDTTTSNSYIYGNSLNLTNDGTDESPGENSAVKSYLYKIPNDNVYLTIPILSGINSNNVLVEGIDFNIENLHYIRFINTLKNKMSSRFNNTREFFIAPSGLYLLPSLTNMYFETFGETDDPEQIVLQENYTPFVSGWQQNNFSYFEKRKLFAEHLKYFTQALMNKLSKGPNFKNLTEAYCLISGLPFSYTTDRVVSISEDSNYTYLTLSGIQYDIPKPLTLNGYVVGDEIEKFDILVSGITLHDYITSSGIIDYINDYDENKLYYTLGIQSSNRTYGRSHSTNFLNFYKNFIKPAGLLINFFNLPPTAVLTADKDFYDGADNLYISGLINDPESDILLYEWSHIVPLTDYLGSTNLECTISPNNEEFMNTTLSIPPVDRYYKFRLNVSDSDNSPNFDIEVNVSGLESFSTWGDTQFILGDAELRYIYLP